MKFKKSKIIAPDGKIKIYILIIFCAFFDWIQFMIWTVNVPLFENISGSLVSRLSGITIIINALFYYFILRLPIFKHQMFSLIIICICSIIIITTEFFFQEITIFFTYLYFVHTLVITFFCQTFSALLDSIEKYLYEYNFLNPYYVLMLEGLFGFIMSFSYFFEHNYLKDVANVCKKFSIGKIVLFIFLLPLYVILS